MGCYTRPVSRQRLGKHVPIAANRRAILEVFLEMEFSIMSVPMSYKEDNGGHQVSSLPDSMKRGLEPEAEE
jgi:hypothetical protein